MLEVEVMMREAECGSGSLASDDAVESNTKCTAAWLHAVHQQE